MTVAEEQRRAQAREPQASRHVAAFGQARTRALLLHRRRQDPVPARTKVVVDLVQTVSGAELCSKRVAALSTLGVHTLADLRLLSEAHLRTEAGFTLTQTLKLKHQLAAESAADAPRATPTKVRKRQPSERGSGPTEAQRASTQAMQNVMAGSDPATWVVTHTPQSRFTQQEISFLLSLSHDMLYELPWDSRSSSSARASKSLSIEGTGSAEPCKPWPAISAYAPTPQLLHEGCLW